MLDFAGAYFDFRPEFSDEVWEEREAKWSEEFGDDWPVARAVLDELEDYGVYMLDPSRTNIRFR